VDDFHRVFDLCARLVIHDDGQFLFRRGYFHLGNCNCIKYSTASGARRRFVTSARARLTYSSFVRLTFLAMRRKVAIHVPEMTPAGRHLERKISPCSAR
jgi:hypothetical protein